MEREIKLACGLVLIKYFHSNIMVFLNGKSFSHTFDGDIEYSVEENLNDFIENDFEYYFHLTLSKADKEKLKDCLHNLFYMHSKEIYGKEN